jgi:K+-sensing histidine kinase KdpD
MAAPVHDGDKVVGSLTIASYQTDRKYTESEQEVLLAFADHASMALSDAKTVDAMREAQRAKDMFFAMASHELKTPLAVIMGTLRTIEKHHRALDLQLREEMLSAAFDRGRELEHLIDRLLQGARAELANVRREMFLPDVIAESIRGFEQSRPLILGPTPEVLVMIDDLAVREVVGVLLENAAAHSPDGTEIWVDSDVGDDTVSISVRNRGSLPADLDHESLFEPFRRGANASSQGVGLGLSIAARLAASVGGHIDAVSVDESVTFTLIFPIDRIDFPVDRVL